MTFAIYSCKTGKCSNQNIYRNLQNFANFNSNLLICDRQKQPKHYKKVFPRKGKGDTALILTYLHSLMADVFPQHCLCFSISFIFRGKRLVKVGPKLQTLGPSLFHKKLKPSILFSNNVFICQSSTTSCENFGIIGQYFGE